MSVNKKTFVFKQVKIIILCSLLLLFNPSFNSNYNANTLDPHNATGLTETSVSSWSELVDAIGLGFSRIYIMNDIRRGINDSRISIRNSVEFISGKQGEASVTITSDVFDEPLITSWTTFSELTLTFTNIILDGEDKVPIGLFMYGTSLSSKLKTGDGGTLEITRFNNDGSWTPSTPWSTFYAAHSGRGAGIYSSLNNFTISIDGKIHNNKAVNGPGVFYRIAANNVLEGNKERLIIENNEALGKADEGGYGGGIAHLQLTQQSDDNTNIVIRNVNIQNNINKNGNGGGIYFERGNVELENVNILNNTSKFGGGIYVNSLASSANFERTRIFSMLSVNGGTKISRNNAIDGGGIYIEGSRTGREFSLSLNDALISENEAKGNGGGVYLRTIQDSRRISNASNDDSLLFIMDGNSNIQANRAENGGGVYLSSNEYTLNQSYGQHGTIFRMLSGSIEDNTASKNGGGICIDNSNIPMSSINSVTSNMNKNSRQKIELDTGAAKEIKGNRAGENGGGIFIDYFPTLTFERLNSNADAFISFSGNEAAEFYDTYRNFPSLMNIYSSVTSSNGTSYFNSYSRHDMLELDFESSLNNFDIGTQYYGSNNANIQNPNKILYSGGIAGDEILPELLTIPIYFQRWSRSLPSNFQEVALIVSKDVELTLEGYNFLYWSAYFGDQKQGDYQSGDTFILNLDVNNHPRADINFIAQWEIKKGTYEVVVWDVIKNICVPDIEVVLIPQFELTHEDINNYSLNKKTDNDGKAVFADIPIGQYITEIKVSEATVHDYIEVEENKTNFKTIYIEYDASVDVNSGRIEVYISDSNDESIPIVDAKISLYMSDNLTLSKIKSKFTNDFGFTFFDIDDVNATYYVIQSKTPQEYNLNPNYFGAINFPDKDGNYVKRIYITNDAIKDVGKEYIFNILTHVEDIPPVQNNEVIIHDNGAVSGLNIMLTNKHTNIVRSITTSPNIINNYNASLSLPAGEYILTIENIPSEYEFLPFNDVVLIPDDIATEIVFKEKEKMESKFGDIIVSVVTSSDDVLSMTTSGPALSSTSGASLLFKSNNKIPLEGATVVLDENVYYTNQDGFVIISDLPFGTYDVMAFKEGYEYNIQHTELSSEQPIVNLLFELKKDESDISTTMIIGAVLDKSTGEGISGATVTIADHTANTDKDGNYIVKDIDPGEYTVLLVASGFYAYTSVINVTSNEMIIQNFMLTPIVDDIPNNKSSGRPDLIYIRREEEAEYEPDVLNDEPQTNDTLETRYNYITGYQGLIGYDQTITREEAVVMLYRLFNDNDEFLIQEFKQEEDNVLYSQAIEFLIQKGILIGYEDASFRLQNKITRAEFAAVLARLNTQRLYFYNPYRDVDEEHWAYQYIITASYSGLVNGYPDGTFLPDNEITRAEAVTMINRMMRRSVTLKQLPNNYKSPFYDIDEDHWAYSDIIGASVNHKYDKTTNKIIIME